MPGQSIFSEEWRECLKAHYMYVTRERDARTERTLVGVLHNVGFTDAELNELKIRATMHVDDVGADYVPDLDLLKAAEQAAAVFAVPDLPVPTQAEAAAPDAAAMVDAALIENAAAVENAAEDSPVEIIPAAEVYPSPVPDMPPETVPEPALEASADPVEDAVETDAEAEPEDEPPRYDASGPQQMTMF